MPRREIPDGSYAEAVESFDLDGWLQAETETLSGGGDELRVRVCPQCGNSEHKLYVNVSKKKWLCYVCDWGRGLGDVSVLMAEVAGQTLFNVRKEIVRALKPLAPVGNADVFTSTLSSLLGDAAVAAPAQFAPVEVPGDESFTGSAGVDALVYARRRGLYDDEIIRYRLRAAYKLREFTGPFLVFPNYRGGQGVSWQGRRTSNKREPRYVSSDDIATWLWPLDEWALPALREGEVTLVEGTFDAAGLWRIGVPAMATYGKKISDSQIALLRELKVRRVTLGWDADSARTSSQRLARGARHLRGEIEAAAVRLSKDFETRIIDFSVGDNPEKVDPGDILHNREAEVWVRERLADALAVGSDRFFLWRLS